MKMLSHTSLRSDRRYDLIVSKFFSDCFSTGPGGSPCCIKDGKPGKIDPKTKKCEEECDCVPGDPSSPKGVKVCLQ